MTAYGFARIVAALGVTVAVSGLLAPGAGAAAGPVAPGFLGVTYDREVADASARTQDVQWNGMARAGVRAVRVVFRWDRAQPDGPGRPRFGATDDIVARAARRHLGLLPVVIYAPAWARVDPSSAVSPPQDPQRYAAYLTALVHRYGPRGSFWREHPGLPRRPLRDYQVWNEPAAPFQWSAPNWERGYGALLRAAHRALKAADPGSRTVLAGLANRTWVSLESLYAKGNIAGAFDVATMHIYTATPNFAVLLARKVRRVLRRHGAARMPAWITEIGLPASKGRTHSPNTLQTTDRGMASALTKAYANLAAVATHSDVLVQNVYWYTWASSYRGDDIFEYAGLRSFQDGRGTDRPALAAFRALSQPVTTR